jgi:transcriptional regulator with XRE-family HTH domain
MMTKEQFGRRLKAILDAKGLTAADVAAMIWGRKPDKRGIPRAVGSDRLSVWINGKSLPDKENLAKLAKALDMPTEKLMPGSDLEVAIKATPDASVTYYSDHPDELFVDASVKQFHPTAKALEFMAIFAKLNAKP